MKYQILSIASHHPLCCMTPIPPACMAGANEKAKNKALIAKGCCARCPTDTCNGKQPCPKKTQETDMTPTTELAKEAETSFEYLGITDPKQKAALADATKSLRNRIERATQNIIEIGKRLTEVKKMLGHGKFLAWIEKEFGMSERTARNFMAVSLKFKSANFADFQPSALYLLASPFTPDEAREEAVELASKGEKITHKKAKEIKEKHAPKKEVTPRERKEPEAPATDPEAEPQETIGAFKAEYEFSELPAGYGKQTYPENEYGDLMRWLRDQMVRVLNQANLQQRRIDMTDAALVRLFVTVGEDYFEVQTALASMRKRR